MRPLAVLGEGAETMITFAEGFLVGSAALVAVTVTIGEAGMAEGAVLKDCLPAVGTTGLDGLTLSKTAIAATMVRLAKANLVESATLVTFKVTSAGEGKLVSGTYNPLVEILPHAPHRRFHELRFNSQRASRMPFAVWCRKCR